MGRRSQAPPGAAFPRSSGWYDCRMRERPAMTDENRPEGQPTEETPASPESATAVAAPPEEQKPEEQKAEAKLNQKVEIRDTGPCKKHIKVVIDRQDIDDRMGELFKKLVHESNVTGFRPGKAPKKLVE